MIVPDDIQQGKHNVEGVKDIESHQEVVEADLLFLEKNKDRQRVAHQTQSPNKEHEGSQEVRERLEPLSFVDHCHVLLGVVAAILIIDNLS